MANRITVPELRARKATAGRGDKIAMVTAYDATFARMFDAAGVDAMLVGDSLGMVIQGGTSTLPVTVEEICYHGRAVVRGTQRAHVIGDMPFMSYQAGAEQALANAGRMMKEGGFESVKLEGGREIADVVHRMVQMGIPVVGHVGLMPQRMHAMGGFKVQGKEAEAALARLDAMARRSVDVPDAEPDPEQIAAFDRFYRDVLAGVRAGDPQPAANEARAANPHQSESHAH